MRLSPVSDPSKDDLSSFQHTRAHNLSRPLLRPKDNPATIVALPPASNKKPVRPDPEVLRALYDVRTTPYRCSFLSRLNGFVVGRRSNSNVVAADWEARSPWMDLMEDVRAHYALKLYDGFFWVPLTMPVFNALMRCSPDRDVVQASVAPITYVTLTAEHLPQVHDLLRRSFWSGIDGLCSIVERRMLLTSFHHPQLATPYSMFLSEQRSLRYTSISWSDAPSLVHQSRLT